MSVLPIITIPDPFLRKISDPVEKVDSAVVKLMDDMLETMYAAPGIGLAAIQVGVPRRIIVIDAADEGEPKNPLFSSIRKSSRWVRRRGSTKRAACPFPTCASRSNGPRR